MTQFQLKVLSLDHTNTISESEFHFVRLETGSGPFQQYEYYTNLKISSFPVRH